MRLDVYLATHKLSRSRSHAQDVIKEGRVYVNQKVILKASFDVTDDDLVDVMTSDLDFVSRGGMKLLGAIEDFHLDLNKSVVVDIGASSGGFSDCALYCHASKVYSIDVGTLQLSEKLRTDSRIVCMENTNALDLRQEHFYEKIDYVVMDVSFISVTMLLPHLIRLFDQATFIVLIKPQFEAGKKWIGKNGIVKDKKVHLHVLNNIAHFLLEKQCTIFGLSKCKVCGRDGNQEYFICFVPYHATSTFQFHSLQHIVYD